LAKLFEMLFLSYHHLFVFSVVRAQLGACELCGLGQLEFSQSGVEVSQGYRHTGDRQAFRDRNLGSVDLALNPFKDITQATGKLFEVVGR
jgi:hypothetical protein